MIRYYPAIIERGTHGFGVFFPDLPGCTSAGDTLQETVRNAESALQGHLAVSAEYGDALPDPSELDATVIGPVIAEVSRVLVRVEVAAHDPVAALPQCTRVR